ncbi:MAG: hypothetical protein RR426_08825, partial [Oscillospiraceae bacterium]
QHFKVTEQHIERLEWRSLVADSRQLLAFHFAFDTLWDGVSKTAVITTGGATYHCLIGADGLIAPAHMPVLRVGSCTVSVFGGDLYTADACVLPIASSGLRDGGTPPAPPADIYHQLVALATEAKAAAAAALSTAEGAKQAAETALQRANDTQNTAAIAARDAVASATEARAAADRAVAVVGGDFATRTDAQGYVAAHNGEIHAHPGLSLDGNHQ